MHKHMPHGKKSDSASGIKLRTLDGEIILDYLSGSNVSQESLKAEERGVDRSER